MRVFFFLNANSQKEVMLVVCSSLRLCVCVSVCLCLCRNVWESVFEWELVCVSECVGVDFVRVCGSVCVGACMCV